MRIGTFIDKDGKTLPLNSSGTIYVYEDNRDTLWTCVEAVPFVISPNMNIREIRQKSDEVSSLLKGCKALIVDNCVGILNCIFEDELHIRLVMISGNPFPFFDGVKNGIRQNAIKAIERIEQEQKVSRSQNPILVGDVISGLYRINLSKVYKENESTNPKDIILSFFQKNDFLELEIICDQPPQWIEQELTNLNFRMKTEMRRDGFCHAFVYPSK